MIAHEPSMMENLQDHAMNIFRDDFGNFDYKKTAKLASVLGFLVIGYTVCKKAYNFYILKKDDGKGNKALTDEQMNAIKELKKNDDVESVKLLVDGELKEV